MCVFPSCAVAVLPCCLLVWLGKYLQERHATDKPNLSKYLVLPFDCSEIEAMSGEWKALVDKIKQKHTHVV